MHNLFSQCYATEAIPLKPEQWLMVLVASSLSFPDGHIMPGDTRVKHIHGFTYYLVFPLIL